MRVPAFAVLANNTGHNHVRNTHSKPSENSQLAPSDIIEEQEGWDAGHKLADINHTRQDKSHVVALAEGCKEGRRVVHKGVDPRELD